MFRCVTVGLVGGVFGWIAGCSLDVPPQPRERCGAACSAAAHCDNGRCACDPGFLGDPYAAHGCQPQPSASPCETTCGLNAYCSVNECVCADGFAAVCGTGDCLAEQRLCDGAEDCANGADEDATLCDRVRVSGWSLIDDCDDGLAVYWRLWAEERDWVWPGVETAFVSDGLGVSSYEEVECLDGELICFGASAGTRAWGVGIERDQACDDCCFACADAVDIGSLVCD